MSPTLFTSHRENIHRLWGSSLVLAGYADTATERKHLSRMARMLSVMRYVTEELERRAYKRHRMPLPADLEKLLAADKARQGTKRKMKRKMKRKKN